MAIIARAATTGESQPKPNVSSIRPRRHSTIPTTEIEAAPRVARQPITVQRSRWPRRRANTPARLHSTVAVSTKMTPRRRADFSPGTGKPPVRLLKESPAMIGSRAAQATATRDMGLRRGHREAYRRSGSPQARSAAIRARLLCGVRRIGCFVRKVTSRSQTRIILGNAVRS